METTPNRARLWTARTSRPSRHPPFPRRSSSGSPATSSSALKTVYDPEIPADIYELGLIYKVDIDDSRHVSIDMTLTAPGCPVAGDMPHWVEDAVAAVPGVSGAKANLTFDPPWSPERMSDEAKVAIGWW